MQTSKPLINHTQEEDSIKISCVICLAKVNLTICGKLPCLHQEFCFECILDWSSILNKCPLCKFKFESILRISNQKIILVDDKEYENNFDYEIFPCSSCGYDGIVDEMMICDRCKKGFHVNCLGMNSTPHLAEWFCDDCLVNLVGWRARVILKAMIRCGRRFSVERKRLKRLRDCRLIDS